MDQRRMARRTATVLLVTLLALCAYNKEHTPSSSFQDEQGLPAQNPDFSRVVISAQWVVLAVAQKQHIKRIERPAIGRKSKGDQVSGVEQKPQGRLRGTTGRLEALRLQNRNIQPEKRHIEPLVPSRLPTVIDPVKESRTVSATAHHENSTFPNKGIKGRRGDRLGADQSGAALNSLHAMLDKASFSPRRRLGDADLDVNIHREEREREDIVALSPDEALEDEAPSRGLKIKSTKDWWKTYIPRAKEEPAAPLPYFSDDEDNAQAIDTMFDQSTVEEISIDFDGDFDGSRYSAYQPFDDEYESDSEFRRDALAFMKKEGGFQQGLGEGYFTRVRRDEDRKIKALQHGAIGDANNPVELPHTPDSVGDSIDASFEYSPDEFSTPTTPEELSTEAPSAGVEEEPLADEMLSVSSTWPYENPDPWEQKVTFANKGLTHSGAYSRKPSRIPADSIITDSPSYLELYPSPPEDDYTNTNAEQAHFPGEELQHLLTALDDPLNPILNTAEVDFPELRKPLPEEDDEVQQIMEEPIVISTAPVTGVPLSDGHASVQQSSFSNNSEGDKVEIVDDRSLPVSEPRNNANKTEIAASKTLSNDQANRNKEGKTSNSNKVRQGKNGDQKRKTTDSRTGTGSGPLWRLPPITSNTGNPLLPRPYPSWFAYLTPTGTKNDKPVADKREPGKPGDFSSGAPVLPFWFTSREDFVHQYQQLFCQLSGNGPGCNLPRAGEKPVSRSVPDDDAAEAEAGENEDTDVRETDGVVPMPAESTPGTSGTPAVSPTPDLDAVEMERDFENVDDNVISLSNESVPGSPVTPGSPNTNFQDADSRPSEGPSNPSLKDEAEIFTLLPWLLPLFPGALPVPPASPPVGSTEENTEIPSNSNENTETFPPVTSTEGDEPAISEAVPTVPPSPPENTSEGVSPKVPSPEVDSSPDEPRPAGVSSSAPPATKEDASNSPKPDIFLLPAISTDTKPTVKAPGQPSAPSITSNIKTALRPHYPPRKPMPPMYHPSAPWPLASILPPPPASVGSSPWNPVTGVHLFTEPIVAAVTSFIST